MGTRSMILTAVVGAVGYAIIRGVMDAAITGTSTTDTLMTNLVPLAVVGALVLGIIMRGFGSQR